MTAQTEFPDLAVDNIPKAILEKLDLIMKLLSSRTSLSVVSEFLKSKNLPHSAGSWEDMREKRIAPYLSSSKLKIEDLTRLLSDAEEFGRSHTFLYTAKRKDVEFCMQNDHIRTLCQKLGHEPILTEPLIIDLPCRPTLTEIRTENLNDQPCWVFKVIEKRREKEFVSEKTEGDRYFKEWKFSDVRAVNVVRLHSSGFLELRIQSHISSSKYAADVQRIWLELKDFLPSTLFSPFSLAKSKSNFLEQREALKTKIRFSDSTMTNNNGTTLVASTGAVESDLFSDSGATASLDQFLGHGASCDSSNIWWRPQEGQTTREIHMLLSGLDNEFAITADCTKMEYEYVLNELRTHSK